MLIFFHTHSVTSEYDIRKLKKWILKLHYILMKYVTRGGVDWDPNDLIKRFCFTWYLEPLPIEPSDLGN